MRGETRHTEKPEPGPASQQHRPNGTRARSSNGTAGWVAEIHRLWTQGATGTFALANVVFQARKSLRHGAWAALWESGRMPFSKSKADMLVGIGQGLGDLNADTCAHLPRGWRVLYLLSKLDRESLLRELASGAIHPKLTFNAARELIARWNGKHPRTAVRSFNFVQRLGRFQEFVHTTLGQWSPAERTLAAQTLSQLRELIAPDASRVTLRIAPVPAARASQNHSTRHPMPGGGRDQSRPLFQSMP